MDVFIDKALIHAYFIQGSVSSEKTRQLSNIFTNPHNNFFLNKDFWNSLMKEVDSNSPLLDFYQQFLTRIVSDGNTIPTNIVTNFDDDFVSSINEVYKRYIVEGKHADKCSVFLSLNDIDGLEINSVGVLQRVAPPNNHWVYFKLAEVNPNALTVRYYDFTTNDSITDFFENILKVINNPSVAWVFDRQRNVNHSCFNFLIGKVRFHYMTLKFAHSDRKYVINQLTHKYRSTYVFSAHSSKIHERQLIVGDLIVDMDEDFENITADRPTWKIDITCSKNIAERLLLKKSHFRRIMY